MIFLSEYSDDFDSITKENIWYLYHIKKSIERCSKKVYIWGAGKYGSVAVEWCRILELSIEGYIDSVKTGEYNGYAIYKPEEADYRESLVIVGVYNFESCQKICKYLDNKGLQRNTNYFLMKNNPCL